MERRDVGGGGGKAKGKGGGDRVHVRVGLFLQSWRGIGIILVVTIPISVCLPPLLTCLFLSAISYTPDPIATYFHRSLSKKSGQIGCALLIHRFYSRSAEIDPK